MTEYKTPNDINAERLVLSALLVDSNAYFEVSSIITSKMFFDASNSLIFDCIVKLNDKGDSVDIVSVANHLNTSKQLEKIGGYVYLAQLSAMVASAAHVEYHARIVFQTWAHREHISITQRAMSRAMDNSIDFYDSAIKTMNEIEALVSDNSTSAPVHISATTNDVYANISSRQKAFKEQKVIGIRTGLHDLDKQIGGWKTGLYVIGARPAMGKTAFILKFAREAGVPVAIFSLEMTKESLTERVVHGLSGVDSERFRVGNIDNFDLSKIEIAINEANCLNIHIDDQAGLTVRQLRISAKLLKKQGKCSMIMIDYLGLMDLTSDEKGMPREQQVSTATRKLKQLSKELDVPIILLAQLNRGVEARNDKRPTLSDLRESGAIEQDADMVAFLYRDEYYDKNSQSVGIGEFIIAKQRGGAVGTVFFKYNPALTEITDFNDNFNQNTDKLW